jgi:hypothetical protein
MLRRGIHRSCSSDHRASTDRQAEAPGGRLSRLCQPGQGKQHIDQGHPLRIRWDLPYTARCPQRRTHFAQSSTYRTPGAKQAGRSRPAAGTISPRPQAS